MELIHKLADCPLNIYKVFFGYLTLWVILAYNHYPDALPSDPGVTKLPTLFGPLSLPTLASASGRLLSLAWALWVPLAFRGFQLCRMKSSSMLSSRCTGLLQSLWPSAWSSQRLAAARVRKPSLPCLFFDSTTAVLSSNLEAESANLLCQALSVLQTDTVMYATFGNYLVSL